MKGVIFIEGHCPLKEREEAVKYPAVTYNVMKYIQIAE